MNPPPAHKPTLDVGQMRADREVFLYPKLLIGEKKRFQS